MTTAAKSLKIGDKTITKGQFPFILAEMACAHDGSVERAIQMVNDAADGGADGVQFQLFATDRLATPRYRFYKVLKSLELSYADYGRIFEATRKRGLKVFVNPMTVDAIESIKTLGADAVKVHSSDLSNPETLKSLVAFKVPISVSAGGSSEQEIGSVLELLKAEGAKDLILMHGFQAFPTTLQDSQLNYIPTLEKKFGAFVGYQDHVDGGDELARIVPAVAMALGAVLLEKHVTDSRERRGTDFQSSLDRDGFAHFVRITKGVYTALGESTKEQFSPAETEYRKTFKKSLVAVRDIAKGEAFSNDNIFIMRGEKLGVTPKEMPQVLGKKSRTALKKFDVIQPEDVFELSEVH